jgi:predicted metal-dependent enzyme (double-stranded beta helix superfamily)
MKSSHFIAPGFSWIHDLIATSPEGCFTEDRFIPTALEIVKRLGKLGDDLGETLTACVHAPRLFQAISVTDAFASREIVAYANDAANLVVEINLWRGTRATAVHQHVFYGATAVLAGAATEIVYAPSETSGNPPETRAVAPVCVVEYRPGDAFPVYAANDFQAGVVHKVLHEHPLTVTTVCRAGFQNERRNAEFSFEDGRRVADERAAPGGETPGVAEQILRNLSAVRQTKHASRDMLDLADWAMACGKEEVFDALDLKVFRDLCAYVRHNLHSRAPHMTALNFSRAFAKQNNIQFLDAASAATDGSARRNVFSQI